jgi:hypothetical protein
MLLVVLLSITMAAFGADVTGRFDAGTKYEEPALHAPASVSRMFVRALSQSGSVDLPATGSGGMLIWTLGPKATTRLRTPHGAMLQPSDRGSLERGLRRFREGGDEVVHVLQTAAATYKLDVESIGSATVVAAEPDSMLTLSTWVAPLSRQPGQPVTLHAELRDGTTPLRDAKVTARLASPNGKAFDVIELVEQGEGIYAATIADLPELAPGTWQARFDAEGQTANGIRFARTGSGELVAERGAARLGVIRTDVVTGALRVSLDADIALAGAYRFDVIIADDAGNAVAWGEGVRKLETGATTLELDIPLAHLGGTPVERLKFDVRLLGLDVIGVAGRVVQ